MSASEHLLQRHLEACRGRGTGGAPGGFRVCHNSTDKSQLTVLGDRHLVSRQARLLFDHHSLQQTGTVDGLRRWALSYRPPDFRNNGSAARQAPSSKGTRLEVETRASRASRATRRTRKDAPPLKSGAARQPRTKGAGKDCLSTGGGGPLLEETRSGLRVFAESLREGLRHRRNDFKLV